MYKVFIVDDEFSVRYGLRHHISWQDYDMEVVGEAEDGDIALELIDEVRPNIVFADIHMINMNGIEMAQQLRECHPEIKVVFVSGYDNVDYMKSALQIHAVDYVFKPVDMMELDKVLRHLQETLMEEDYEHNLMLEMQERLERSLPILREKFFHSLMRGEVTKETQLQDKLSYLKLTFPMNSSYSVSTIRIDNRTKVFESFSEKDRQLMIYAMLNIIQELIDRSYHGYVIESQDDEIVLLLNLGHDMQDWEARLLSLLEEIQESLLQWLKISVTIGVGEKVNSLIELPISFTSSQLAADQRWHLGNQKIITIDSAQSYNLHTTQQESFDIDRVVTVVKAGDTERLSDELQVLFESIVANRSSSYNYSRNMSAQLVLLTSRTLADFGIEIEQDEADVLERIFKEETLVALKETIHEYLLHVCGLINERRTGKNHNIIERVKEIINERYMDNITISDIAENVYMSPTYISLIFRKETGETIYEYLTKVRIERAKDLLKDPIKKLYEVCDEVGYTDPSHFSKLFKKHTGQTPSRYRELVI